MVAHLVVPFLCFDVGAAEQVGGSDAAGRFEGSSADHAGDGGAVHTEDRCCLFCAHELPHLPGAIGCCHRRGSYNVRNLRCNGSMHIFHSSFVHKTSPNLLTCIGSMHYGLAL
jgi:hypothetical protein